MTDASKRQGRPNIIGITRGLGPLEAQVLQAMGELGRPASVKEVCDALSREGYFAYQGVTNCMRQLLRKRILERRLKGQAYSYRLLVDPEEIAAQIVAETLAHLPGDLDRVVCRVLGIDPEVGAAELARIRRKLGSAGTATQQ
jgi:predicted transcriptional regulator